MKEAGDKFYSCQHKSNQHEKGQKKNLIPGGRAFNLYKLAPDRLQSANFYQLPSINSYFVASLFVLLIIKLSDILPV